MTTDLLSTSPDLSATVSASAGTGKTWLLVTRLIRLLLAGERPEGILAVTFTRKAAAEMQTRLNDRLLEMACCDEQHLEILLIQIGAPLDHDGRRRARTLYEELLTAPNGVKTATFHAFCQDILRRFPLEAGIPPGFELLETTADFQKAAWDALCADASREPNSQIAQALEQLMDISNGMENARTSLNSFLTHRSDWWAFTEGQENHLAFASDTLTRQLGISLQDNPEADFFTADLEQDLREFIQLLGKHATATNKRYSQTLYQALNPDNDYAVRFDNTVSAFLTQKGEPLKRDYSKALEKSLGESGVVRFLELHGQICVQIAATRRHQNAKQTLLRNLAWYQVGNSLLRHFQRLKTEQRILDFADLEWQAYRLLNHSNNVHWIQYKLDQRIDHLLVDEFQDTNPTQWRLILPLLQELAAGESERRRSVFLVGDSKQSIYRFRRADPELFEAAQAWLKENLNTVSQPLDTSWRSAEAIISFVNRLFGDGPLHNRLSHFSPHTTHHKDLWGHVEILPLIESEQPAGEKILSAFRDPLHAPREFSIDQRYLDEGHLIAARINQLMSENTLIGFADDARPLRHSDILILLRNRTHAPEYEQALREAGIPYTSANRGTLLESQEARDLVNLLELLVAPFNNLALASLLRSPLFDCDNNTLIALAKAGDGHWINRLECLAQQSLADSPLSRANQLLSKWRALADVLPVHDLLDRIFSEGNVINRYQAAYPVHLQHRVVANLTRFLELALEVDSGRYPTIGHFVARLQTLRQQEQDAPDEGISTQTDARVRLMTIHASKGLEAPVVFMVDCSNAGRDKNAYQAMIDWPAQADHPHSFLLTGKKENLDPFSQGIADRNTLAETREDANLFYVAVTRARQFLFLSGVQPSRGSELGWYGMAVQQLLPDAKPTDRPDDNQPMVINSGIRPDVSTTSPITKPETASFDIRLSKPVNRETIADIISPSLETGTADDKHQTGQPDLDQQTRGIAIHRMLELLCEGQQTTDILQRVASECGLAGETAELKLWITEAESTFKQAELADLFDQNHYTKAFNEVPIHYLQQTHSGQQMVFGIIDRLIVKHDSVLIIDYKTHPIDNQPEQIDSLVSQYRQQLHYYCQGVRRLWKNKSVRAGLLFTNIQTFIEIDV